MSELEISRSMLQACVQILKLTFHPARTILKPNSHTKAYVLRLPVITFVIFNICNDDLLRITTHIWAINGRGRITHTHTHTAALGYCVPLPSF